MTPYAEVIGDPIAHSRSPLIHGFWSKSLGRSINYRAFQLSPGELPAYFESRRADALWRGCNLTAPLKQEALPLLDCVGASAAAMGAVNCVISADGKLIGYNSDVDGIAEALSGAEQTARPVTVIGAGGAARAAVTHLAEWGPSVIRIVARNPDRARSLGELVPPAIAFEVLQLDAALRAFADAAVIVNASPLGMAGAPPMPQPVIEAVGAAANDAVVMDMAYRPLETALLRAARSHGLRAVDGLAMLIGQAGPAFRFFFGEAPSRDRDAELCRLLRASLVERPIGLVGMPGAGKTTTGCILADRLGLEFLDSDLEIERSTDKTISELFELYGEAQFREIEQQIISGLIGEEPKVIALGGGALSDPSTCQLVSACCITVWLQSSVRTLANRPRAAQPRTLLAGRDPELALSELASAREPSFAEADIRIPEGSPEEAAEEIIRVLADNYAKNLYPEGIDAPSHRRMIGVS